MASIRVSSVTFEHHLTGFGVGHASPRVSWRFSTDNNIKNWSQESYEIQIVQHDNVEIKTYHVESSESVLVPWPHQALQSRESAWVKIRSHGKSVDAAGHVTNSSSDWSSPALVEAALLDNRDWTAKLTTSTLISNKNEPKRPLRFRKVFPLSEQLGAISKARLYITAHGVYEAFINGQRIGTEEMAPGWTSYRHRLLYQTFDVTASLVSGKSNTFGIEVGEGWFAGRIGFEGKRCFYGDRLAFLAQLEVLFENGQSYTLVSDSSWKSHHSATTRSEIYDGEDYDSREEQEGWNSDPKSEDHSWTSTEELDFPSARLLASDTPAVRALEKVSPVKIFKSKSGKTLVDFGQNLVGKLEVRIPVANGTTNIDGHTVSFSHAEVLERDELGTRPLRGAKPIDNVTLSHKPMSTWSPKFTFHGFRYVQIDGWPTNDAMPNPDDITALVLHSDMRRTGWFSCSDSLVNKLHENVLWSMKGNFLSVPTDCPQRDERLGWTGDIQVFSPSANFIFDTQGFLGNWLDDVSVEQLEDGDNGIPGLVVPNVIPPSFSIGGQCAWHDATVLTPWDLYNSSGDVEILRRQYPSMKAWVDKGISRGPNGLWDQNIWQLADWLDPAAPPDEPGKALTDGVLVADAYLVRVLETISKVSSLLGESEDAGRYERDASSVKKTFGQEYITPSGLLVGDTQTAHALAICFGLFNDKNQVIKSASRLSHLVHSARYRIGTGFVGTPLISHALSDTGNYQLAYSMLLEQECPSWLYPITMGATTIWERWDSMLSDGSINPGSMTSFNHYALGSVAHWLHKNVGGISPLTPGWQTIKVRPLPGGTITSADVAYESPYGRIECAWKVNVTDGTFSMTVVVPPNSKAVVILPSDWNEKGQDGEEKSTSIGSGRYEFSCPYKPAEWPPKAEFARSTFRMPV
jgi:alpha-L-rhamnosidase